MKFVWTPQAVEDLNSLYLYLLERNPDAAKRTLKRVYDVIDLVLRDNPRAGRPGRVEGTRELVITQTPYVVPYRLRKGTIEVLRVYHGARPWVYWE